MAKIEKFEDIIAWQKGIELCNDIYTISNSEKFSRDFELRNQMRRSAISIPSNIAEGFERESNNQFIYFLVIAKASAGELRTQLTISKNQNYITENDFNNLYNKCLEISRMISGFITYLRERKKQNTDK